MTRLDLDTMDLGDEDAAKLRADAVASLGGTPANGKSRRLSTLSPEERSAAIALYRETGSPRAVATRFGLALSSVQHLLTREGVARDARKRIGPDGRQTLTARQRRVLEFVVSFVASHGYAPTLREIGAELGIRSTNGVSDHLRLIERKGYLRRDATLSRGLVLVDGSLAADGATVRCPNDDGGGDHVRGSFYLPGLPLDEHAARWSAIGVVFGVCPCGAKTVIAGRA